MNSSMGERLAWARNQQALILQQVSERSGLAIGYISQLEKGAKKNPTIDAVARLAHALEVTVAFLMGETPGPDHDDRGGMLLNAQAYAIRQRFSDCCKKLPDTEHSVFAHKTQEERFAFVVDFLCHEFPDRFTRPVVAYQLGLSVRGLNDILERRVQISPGTLRQMSRMTGIPSGFFDTGCVERARGLMPLDQLLAYAEALALVAQANLTPEQLIKLIQEGKERSLEPESGAITLSQAMRYSKPIAEAVRRGYAPEQVEMALDILSDIDHRLGGKKSLPTEQLPCRN